MKSKHEILVNRTDDDRFSFTFIYGTENTTFSAFMTPESARSLKKLLLEIEEKIK